MSRRTAEWSKYEENKRLIICVTAFVCVLSLAACGESKKSDLAGSWSGNNGGYDVTFTFNEDGTGEMSISGIQLNITYTVDGDTLTVNKTVLDGTQTEDYTYKLSNKGKTLTLTSASGDTELTKN